MSKRNSNLKRLERFFNHCGLDYHREGSKARLEGRETWALECEAKASAYFHAENVVNTLIRHGADTTFGGEYTGEGLKEATREEN